MLFMLARMAATKTIVNRKSIFCLGDMGSSSASPLGAASEHDPEKWEPVFRKRSCSTKGCDHDPIQSDRIVIE
jgi:hypothetical protein